MTDQERLENIKEQWKNGYPVTAGSNEEPQLHRDFEWLIEQAERVQELENIIYQDARQGVLEGLYEENQRYREALEKILINQTQVPTQYEKTSEIARKALEETE